MFKNRKIISWMILITLLSIGPAAGNAYALLDTEKPWLPEKGDNLPVFSASNSFMTKYIWRGWNLGDEPVMQTDLSLSWYGLTIDFWSNYSLNNDKSKDGGRYQEFTEIDYTVDYTFNVGEVSEKLGTGSLGIFDPVSISAGYIYYTFPNIDWKDKYFDTQEVYFGVSYDCLLQPFFKWYWDVDHGKGASGSGGDGSYFLFGIGHTFEFKESGIAANLGITTGIVDEQWTDKAGWGDMVFSGDVSIPVFNYFTITPSVAYSLILDRGTYDHASENEFYGGITIGFEY